MLSISLRASLVAAVAAAALSAQAVDAYSNIPASPYYNGGGFFVSGTYPQDMSYKFTSGTTGNLSGFKVAMNNYLESGQKAFNLDLYTDNAGQLGTLLGSFSGLS